MKPISGRKFEGTPEQAAFELLAINNIKHGVSSNGFEGYVDESGQLIGNNIKQASELFISKIFSNADIMVEYDYDDELIEKAWSLSSEHKNYRHIDVINALINHYGNTN